MCELNELLYSKLGQCLLHSGPSLPRVTLQPIHPFNLQTGCFLIKDN